MYDHLTDNPTPSRELLMHHRIQDLLSYWLHVEAVRLIKQDPSLVQRLQQTQARWAERDDLGGEPLRRKWDEILATQDWGMALARTDQGQELRQASPLATVLPPEVRLKVLERIRDLKLRCQAAAS
jgi:hypothetical protein